MLLEGRPETETKPEDRWPTLTIAVDVHGFDMLQPISLLPEVFMKKLDP